MEQTIIKYSIDYEKHLKSIFPFTDRQHMINEILGGMTVKKITCTITGHDEEEENTTHVIDSNQIKIPESNEDVLLDDERIITGIKRLILICEEHYTTRDNSRLPTQGIEWKIISK